MERVNIIIISIACVWVWRSLKVKVKVISDVAPAACQSQMSTSLHCKIHWPRDHTTWLSRLSVCQWRGNCRLWDGMSNVCNVAHASAVRQ